MARFLFVVPPMVGHINPTVSVAAELEARGHEVAWVGHRLVVGPVLPDGAKLFALDTDTDREDFVALAERALSLRGAAALKFLWEEVLIPLAHAMLPGVREVVDFYAPDALCVDRETFAGAVVARGRNLPWATSATTSLDRKESIGDLHKIYAWTEERLAELQRQAGLEPVPMVEESPHLVIVFTTLELMGGENPAPGIYHFVGPSFRYRQSASEPDDFPWDRLRDVPRVLVSLGTLNPRRGERFFRAVAEGLGECDLQVILVAPDSFGPFPDNFIVREWVPQVDLLPHVNAVICHAGHNTVSESLANGLPLVVLPIKDDQPVVAAQVTDAGVGLRLPFARPRPGAIREAVLRVLAEPGFRASAERIRRSFAAAGGASRAAELLEALVGRSGNGQDAR
jgi:MGT family glycosyltransferase